jgi:hypothetical protein
MIKPSKVHLSFLRLSRAERILKSAGGSQLFKHICEEIAICTPSITTHRKQYVFALPHGDSFVGVHDEIVSSPTNLLHPFRHRLNLVGSVSPQLGEILHETSLRLDSNRRLLFRAILAPTFVLWPNCQLSLKSMKYLIDNAASLATLVATSDITISKAFYQFSILRDTMGLPCNQNALTASGNSAQNLSA